jgi:hypothetical protein
VETRNAWRERFIYLTEKGYKYLQEKLLYKEQLQYSFMRSRKRRTTFSPHEYMNLQFVWKYMTETWKNLVNGDVEIYTDTDINNCKLQFINKWGSLEIRPDVMIKIYEEGLNKKLIMAENDTGSMNTIQIYRKFLRYGFYLDRIDKIRQTKDESYYPQVDLYFICESATRLNNLFINGNLAKYFQYTNTFKGKFSIDTKRIAELVDKDFFHFYIMDFEDYNPKEFDLKKTLRTNTLFKNL